jgi:hypothetical protein
LDIGQWHGRLLGIGNHVAGQHLLEVNKGLHAEASFIVEDALIPGLEAQL